MATVFIDKIKNWCGGSRVLAWLLVATVGGGVLLWLTGLVCSLAGVDGSLVTSWLALSASPYALLWHPWTLVTYIAVHYSPLHLLFNSLWLYWFGRMLVDVERERSLLTLFLGGGVTGGILYVLAAWISGISASFLTGDSAAVLSVMTATAVLMPDRRIGLFLLGEIKLRWVALGCILLTLIGGGGSGIPAQGAHLGGVAFGLVWGAARRGIIPAMRFRGRRGARIGRRVNTRVAIKAMSSSVPDSERLDQLLDKIRMSGYESLSAREKNELNYISSRIGR